METRIDAGTLAKSTSQDENKALFALEGEVTSLDLIKDRDSGQSKGFPFVTLTSQGSADKAISKCNANTLGGTKARSRSPSPGWNAPGQVGI